MLLFDSNNLLYDILLNVKAKSFMVWNDLGE